MREHKINHQFIESYSKKFSDRIVDDFFLKQDTISGKEIVSLTKSKQINFLIIKTLFNQWQEETKKLESPFFDFKSDKVKKALVQFMNTLSQYILIEKEDFRPLLENAVEDTMYLIFSPLDFFLAEISKKHPTVLAVKSFKSITKYIKINAEPLNDYISHIEDTGKDKLELDFALQMANDVFENVETAEIDISNFVSAVSGVEPLNLEDVFLIDEVSEPEEEEVKEEEPAFELDSFLNEELGEEPAEEELVVEEEEQEDLAPEDGKTTSIPEETEEIITEDDDDIEDIEPLDLPKAPEKVITNFDDDDIDEFIDETDIPPIDLEPKGVISNYEDSDETEEDPAILNTNFASESVPTINDKLKNDQSEESLAGKLANRNVDNIFASISVNQRYMFTNELFGGSNEDFTEAISFVEECETFDESVGLLVQRYAKPYSWDMNSVEVKELLKVIFRKFRE